jgi:hypothetical protein
VLRTGSQEFVTDSTPTGRGFGKAAAHGLVAGRLSALLSAVGALEGVDP